ncbi:MAG: peptide chain release factor 2, programmed frameshift, partial [uncultured bacterium]
MDKEEAKKKLSDLHQILKISEKKQELLSLREQVKKIDLWQNQQNAIEVTSKLSELENEINEFETLDLIINDESSNDDDFKEAAKIIKNLEQKAILSDEHDASGAILSIHAGTGGVDAMDFAMLLERMYLRFIESDKNQADTNLRINTNITNDANLDKSQRDTSLFGIDRSKWQVTVVDRRMGDEAGIKSVTMIISGQYVYGLLKKEAGVHRLVRLSPFSAKNLRQTSFALVEVLPFIGR